MTSLRFLSLTHVAAFSSRGDGAGDWGNSMATGRHCFAIGVLAVSGSP